MSENSIIGINGQRVPVDPAVLAGLHPDDQAMLQQPPGELSTPDGTQLVEAIHDRKAGPLSEMSIAGEDAEAFIGDAPALVLKEFKSTILPKSAGTRKVDTWHTDAEARDYWEQRVSEYPVMTQVTPRHKLRLSYVFGGRMTVAGEVVIDLAAAAKIKIEGLAE